MVCLVVNQHRPYRYRVEAFRPLCFAVVLGPPKVGPIEVGIAQVGLPKVGPGHVSPSQVGTTQVGSPQRQEFVRLYGVVD